MTDLVEEYLQKVWPASTWSNTTILAGVSGGADSTALLHALCRVAETTGNRANITVAHFNHHLRGTASDEDARFVAELAERLQCQIICDEWQTTQSTSEDSARRARYAFFESAARRIGARCVVLAHTADDQVETVMHRILRGTGVSGLAGIPSSRLLGDDLSIVRPLLGVKRNEIESYLNTINERYCLDSSNAQTVYTRNRIRNQLLPDLRENYNPRVDDALLKLAQLADETSEIIADLAAAWLQKNCLPDSDSHTLSLSCEGRRQTPRLIVCEGLKQWFRTHAWPERGMNFESWCVLAELWGSDSDGAVTLPDHLSAQKKGGRFMIVRPR